MKTEIDFRKCLYGPDPNEEKLEEIARQTKNYRAFLTYLAREENSPFGPPHIAEALDYASAFNERMICTSQGTKIEWINGAFPYALVRLVTKRDKLAEHLLGGEEKLGAFLNRREEEIKHLEHFLKEEKVKEIERIHYRSKNRQDHYLISDNQKVKEKKRIRPKERDEEKNQPDSLRYSRFAMLELDDIPRNGIREVEISDRFRMLEID